MIGLLPLLLAGAFVLFFIDIGCHGHTANTSRLPNPLDIAELNRLAPQGRTALDSTQKAELRQVYADIVQAYSNGQVEVLREWRRKLPERVERVRQNDFDDIERPFFKLFFDEVVLRLQRRTDDQSFLRKSENMEDFEHTVTTMLLFAGIYGDVHLRRRDFGGCFDNLEALVVHWLISYRDYFHEEGRPDLEKVTDRFLAEWIRQIESENGYTRALLIQHIASVRVLGNSLMENCGMTWDEVSQNVVLQTTHGLIKAGYTPKWLDEFKDIPRHAVHREEHPEKLNYPEKKQKTGQGCRHRDPCGERRGFAIILPQFVAPRTPDGRRGISQFWLTEAFYRRVWHGSGKVRRRQHSAS